MPWITIKSCRGEDNYARDCIKRGLKDRGKNDIGRIRDKETDDPMIARFFSEAVVATWLIRSGLHSKKHEAVDNLVLSTI